ncbi:MAG: glycosyltransferase family 4 protein [Syntrophales bacterium]|nr:glycosyltransferase family 4 protein [Syntrophales bacterium]
MKILLVIDGLGSGGAQRQLVNLACALEKRGHNIEFFVYYPENHFRPILDQAGIPVHLHQKVSRYSLASIFALRRLIKERHFDIVLAFLDTPNFYAEISCIGLGNTKLVISERFMYLPGKLALNQRLLQEVHRLADVITVNSHHQRKRMIREFPWMKNKIRTIYNGFDLEDFSPVDNINRKNDRLSLLSISSVAFKKNSLNLAKALAICRDKYQLDVHVDWIGTKIISREGTLPSQQTTEYLNAKGLTDCWAWLGERSDLPQMLANHDALIHVSFFEGLPNVVCEALSCGRPVLVSNVCDHPLLVQDGTSGYIFDPSSAEDIARKIFTFSRLESLARKEMGRAARAFAERHLSLNRFVDEYENLFNKLGGSSKKDH